MPGMKERGCGRIILVLTGWKRRRDGMDCSAFVAAKTGLASLMKTIALEETSYGITATGGIAGLRKEQDVSAASEYALILMYLSAVQKPAGRENIFALENQL
ncbi:hypothetical protein [Domibacillus iocasae]|uniref:Uncharacterized protein n=1 Tax=Domibacillus iocasae TaxID=1714016 RepID=A0A1E7DN91_9BACI|nr:hypothetical protein [Domibacillus iocasae]OES44560.1 hypothetical protein BA724_09825 [Domibacillus iocasae]